MPPSSIELAARHRELQKLKWTFGKTNQMKRNRVAYHVARGRTPEEIAVRERMPTSLVRELMAYA